MYRILLVDDEQSVLNALRRELKDEYDVETFTSPADALQRCQEALFDLVIADYQMPGINGIQFLKKFGEIQPETSRLVLSGHADLDVLTRAINETHIYRFIAKPWDETDLKTGIAQALSYRNIILENRRKADAYRDIYPAAKKRESSNQYRIMLVDGDEGSLTGMWLELTQHPGYEDLYGAMQQEIAQGKSVVVPDFGFVVDTFTSAVKSLEHAKHHDCDLVIATQTLPEMDGIRLLSEFQKIQPDAARILIGNYMDKKVLSKAINEAHVHNFLCLSWKTHELKADALRKSWNLLQFKTAVMQALTSRDLLLDNRQLAGTLDDQGTDSLS